jgi:hypothetical protein
MRDRLEIEMGLLTKGLYDLIFTFVFSIRHAFIRDIRDRRNQGFDLLFRRLTSSSICAILSPTARISAIFCSRAVLSLIAPISLETAFRSALNLPPALVWHASPHPGRPVGR